MPDNPLEAYNIARIDSTSSPKYFGYLNKDGNWCISKEDTGVWTYAIGLTDFSTNWTNRAGLPYEEFNAIF